MRAVKIPNHTKRCGATMSGQYTKGSVCGLGATHEIDGNPYCHVHAGKHALFLFCTEVE